MLRPADRWREAGQIARFALPHVWMAGGLSAFVWGYLVATVLLYHATFAINSVAHIWGAGRFATSDHSRNTWWLAILTLGEGWHNNHHDCMSSARQGFRWWEFDLTDLGLRLLEIAGVVRDLRPFVVREPLAAAPGVPMISAR